MWKDLEKSIGALALSAKFHIRFGGWSLVSHSKFWGTDSALRALNMQST